MNNKIFCRALFVMMIVFGATAGESALAQTTTSYPVTATCTGGGQLCNNLATITVNTSGLLQAQFISSSQLSCSSIRIHWLVDGSEVAVTGFVAPAGSSGFSNLGPVSAGQHILGLQAEGQVGGCNTGTLGGWTGTAQVITGEVAAVATPTLAEWGLIVLSILLGSLAAMQLRSGRTNAN